MNMDKKKRTGIVIENKRQIKKRKRKKTARKGQTDNEGERKRNDRQNKKDDGLGNTTHR